MGSAKEAKEIDLGSGSVDKLLFKLAVPAITAQIINVLYNMVDRMYIGHLPGVGVTFPIIMAISAFAALVSMGGAPRASIMLGKGRKEKAENILGNCTTALIAVALVLTVFFLIFGRKILLMFGASGNTIEYGWAYMQIYSDRHAYRAHRRCLKHHPGPNPDVWVPHGGTWRGSGNHYLPGRFCRMGGAVPCVQQKLPEDTPLLYEAEGRYPDADHCTGRVPLCDAVHGKHPEHLL